MNHSSTRRLVAFLTMTSLLGIQVRLPAAGLVASAKKVVDVVLSPDGTLAGRVVDTRTRPRGERGARRARRLGRRRASSREWPRTRRRPAGWRRSEQGHCSLAKTVKGTRHGSMTVRQRSVVQLC